MVWTFPMQASNGAIKGKFFFAGGWPTKETRQAEEDIDVRTDLKNCNLSKDLAQD